MTTETAATSEMLEEALRLLAAGGESALRRYAETAGVRAADALWPQPRSVSDGNHRGRFLRTWAKSFVAEVLRVRIERRGVR